MKFLGFDPGGHNRFGWACLDVDHDGEVGDLRLGTCSNAEAAIEASVACTANSPVLGIGIDAPLYWVSAGDRNADKAVRTAVTENGGASGTVSHVNSLRGACLVQGVLIAHFSAREWPDALITEAHPKAIRWVLPEFETSLTEFSNFGNEHEKDAALAAKCAWAAWIKKLGWIDLLLGDSNALPPFATKVSYWFPGQ